MTDMTKSEWEALCDGCGKCCLLKLEDENTLANPLYQYKLVAFLTTPTCSCGSYALRKQLVADCVVLTPENIGRNAHWMPSSCAYRLIHEGKDLPNWHPLLTGDTNSTKISENSVAGQTVAEYDIEEKAFEDYATERFS
jgi:uncharacterized cysteine cluster protein YcgN (CxxCxxCC family)